MPGVRADVRRIEAGRLALVGGVDGAAVGVSRVQHPFDVPQLLVHFPAVIGRQGVLRRIAWFRPLALRRAGGSLPADVFTRG